MAMQRTLDPGWPPLTQGRCLVHGCGPMPRILHTCRRMASVSARGVCVWGGITAGVMEKAKRCGISKTGAETPTPAGGE